MVASSIYRSNWDLSELTLEQVISHAADRGYYGIEIYVTRYTEERESILSRLRARGMGLVAQFSTHGTTEREHVQDFSSNVGELCEWNPDIVVLRAGTDRMQPNEVASLYGQLLEESNRHGLQVAFETHRSRPTYNIDATVHLLEALPDMQLTLDLSHWCCVHESLLTGFEDELSICLRRTAHVHARVGHAGGPQIHDLASMEVGEALNRHLDWWGRLLRDAEEDKRQLPTFTPEFGPYPYEVVPDPEASGLPTATDLNESMHGLLRRMMRTQQEGAKL